MPDVFSYGPDPAQEPARAVDAEEPRRAAHRLGRLPGLRRLLHGHRAGQLGAERAVGLLERGTLAGRAGGQVGADVVPDAPGARGGERRHRQRRLPRPQGRADHLLLLVDVDPELHAGDHRQLHRAEVDALDAVVGGVAVVPRAAGPQPLALAVLRLRWDAALAQAAVDPVAPPSERHVSSAPREMPRPRARRGRRWSRGRPRRGHCRAARRRGRTGRGPPAAPPAARRGRRGAG